MSVREVHLEKLNEVINLLGAIVFDANEGNIKTTQEVAARLKPLLKTLNLIRTTL